MRDGVKVVLLLVLAVLVIVGVYSAVSAVFGPAKADLGDTAGSSTGVIGCLTSGLDADQCQDPSKTGDGDGEGGEGG